MKVGTAWMRREVAIRLDLSMSILTTLALPSSSRAMASTSGATVLQGAHQSAVKSMSETGSFLRRLPSRSPRLRAGGDLRLTLS